MSDSSNKQNQADNRKWYDRENSTWFMVAWSGCLGIFIGCLIVPLFKSGNYGSTFKELFSNSALPSMVIYLVVILVMYLIAQWSLNNSKK